MRRGRWLRGGGRERWMERWGRENGSWAGVSRDGWRDEEG